MLVVLLVILITILVIFHRNLELEVLAKCFKGINDCTTTDTLNSSFIACYNSIDLIGGNSAIIKDKLLVILVDRKASKGINKITSEIYEDETDLSGHLLIRDKLYLKGDRDNSRIYTSKEIEYKK